MDKVSARPSVAIFLPSLASGGAERVHINLAPEFILNGWDVTFVLQQKTGALLSQLPQGAGLVSLEARSTFAALMPLVRYLKTAKPDVLLSNLGHNNIVSVWAGMLARTHTRIIASQHNTLSVECRANRSWKFRMLPFFSRLFLRFADAVVCVSRGVGDDLRQVTGLPERSVHVIYNPVVLHDFEQRMHGHITCEWLSDKKLPVILGVGRLVPQKDFGTLIAAFAQARKQVPCRLMLLGEGELLEELTALTRRLGITEHVQFLGFQPNSLPYIRQADVLAMSSRFEGFGNVIVEALACGTPVVSTNCPHGPAEILDNGAYGTLVETGNVDAMAKALVHTLTHAPDKQLLKERGNYFTVKRSGEAYLALFAQLTHKRAA